MEQNNFEKQVQQKMEDLKIQPSEAAWKNIEKRIAKNPNSRKVIFILSFFLLLVIFASLYWMYNPPRTDISETANKNITTAGKNPNTNLSIEKPAQPNKNSSALTDKTEPKIVDVKSGKAANSKVSPEQQPLKLDIEITRENELSRNFRIERKDKIHVDSFRETKNSKKSEEAVASDSLNTNGHTDLVSTTPHDVNQDQNVAQKFINNEAIKKDSSVTSMGKMSSIIKQKTKWQVGFTFSAGTSFVGNSPLNTNISADFLSNPVPSGGSQSPNSYPPSRLSNSIALGAGVFIQKDILAKSKISIGLNYKYFSVKNKVGSKMDSVLSVYYSANPLNDFSNRFHFIEVPVLFDFRLNPEKPLPLFLNVGISVAQMVGTNALQFTGSSSVYYNDNSVFNKTQLGLSTGFSATLFSKDKMPVSVGPYFYYDVTNLADKGLYSKMHFSVIGISGKILLNHK